MRRFTFVCGDTKENATKFASNKCLGAGVAALKLGAIRLLAPRYSAYSEQVIRPTLKVLGPGCDGGPVRRALKVGFDGCKY